MKDGVSLKGYSNGLRVPTRSHHLRVWAELTLFHAKFSQAGRGRGSGRGRGRGRGKKLRLSGGHSYCNNQSDFPYPE